tara:strand:- start:231 stop:1925 length:1695 start_codon:yes stop_codon:yes gene_type:complete
MNKFNIYLNCILQIFFVIIFLSTLNAKSYDRFNKGGLISDYFTGIVLLNENKYNESNRFFKKLDGLEDNHLNFSINYLYSLINSGQISEAFKYAKKLEKKNLDNFESDLITGIYYLKNKKHDLAETYFLKIKKRNSNFILNDFLSDTLLNLSRLSSSNLEVAQQNIKNMDSKLDNIKEIQKVFLHCFYQSEKTDFIFNKLVSNNNVDFSRYNYFYANFLANSGQIQKANKIVSFSAETNPNNILLQQLKLDFRKGKYKSDFNCQNQSHIVAETLYVVSNALSVQSMYNLSNFYLNLSKYLNKDFQAFDTLLAENLYKIGNLKLTIKVYNKLSNKGEAFNWYAAKQISNILIKQKKTDKAIKLLEKNYNDLKDKNIYVKFDFAEFLKSNDKFKKSIKIYTEILDTIDKNHKLYPDVTDGRGIAFERIGKWERAEKDLLLSLEANPNQAYVINYLAYSWIEQGVKIEKSLKMLEKANRLKSNDPFIVDSLGWALFKLKRFEDAKKYLQLAVQLMPEDPIINDHYGDVLWRNGNNIQARYYWNYVLNLDETKKEHKEKITNKLLSGI